MLSKEGHGVAQPTYPIELHFLIKEQRIQHQSDQHSRRASTTENYAHVPSHLKYLQVTLRKPDCHRDPRQNMATVEESKSTHEAAASLEDDLGGGIEAGDCTTPKGRVRRNTPNVTSPDGECCEGGRGELEAVLRRVLFLSSRRGVFCTHLWTTRSMETVSPVV